MCDTVVARCRATKVSWRIVDRMIIVESTIIVIKIIVIQVPCQIVVSACKAQHTARVSWELGGPPPKSRVSWAYGVLWGFLEAHKSWEGTLQRLGLVLLHNLSAYFVTGKQSVMRSCLFALHT